MYAHISHICENVFVTYDCVCFYHVCPGLVEGHFFYKMTPNFIGLSYVTVTPNIMGLSYVQSLMGLSYVPGTHNIMGPSYVE